MSPLVQSIDMTLKEGLNGVIVDVADHLPWRSEKKGTIQLQTFSMEPKVVTHAASTSTINKDKATNHHNPGQPAPWPPVTNQGLLISVPLQVAAS